MRLPIFALLALACCAASAQDGATLRARMGTQDFDAAGLQKLSPQELAHLERWVASHAPELAAALPASEAHSAKAAARQPATPTARSGRDVVDSRIAGRFDGWHAGSVLTLENGQQWRVVDDSGLTMPQALEHPAVTVRPGLMGGWNLKVEGYNTRARVAPAN
ncbi:MAG: hypothetical protein HOQ10_11845 [Frateuria sp.]|nr:hypothetical protein [Frateuria sp.]